MQLEKKKSKAKIVLSAHGFNSVGQSEEMLGVEKQGIVMTSCLSAVRGIEGTPIRAGHVANVYYDRVLTGLGSGHHSHALYFYEKGRSYIEPTPDWWEPRFLFLKALLLDSESSTGRNRIEVLFNESIKGEECVSAAVPVIQTHCHPTKWIIRSFSCRASVACFGICGDAIFRTPPGTVIVVCGVESLPLSTLIFRSTIIFLPRPTAVGHTGAGAGAAFWPESLCGR